MAKIRAAEKPVRRGERIRTHLSRIFKWILQIALVLAAAALFSYAFCSSVTVQDSSMSPTVESGDSVLISRAAYAITGIGRGDIVAYQSTQDGEETVHIRRVIGLPGEKIQIQDGLILINGETYLETQEFPVMTSGGIAEETISLGIDEYFVLGDNRNSSEDSRFAEVGNITRSSIIGKVWLRTSPLSRFGFM